MPVFVVPASNGEDNAPVREFNQCHVPGGNPAGGQFAAKGGGKCEGGPTKGKALPPTSPEYFSTAKKDVVRGQTGEQTPLGREVQRMFAQNMPMQEIMKKTRAMVVARGETPEERGSVKVKVDGKEYEVDTPSLIARMEIESARTLGNGDSKYENTEAAEGGRRYTKERLALHEQILTDPRVNNPNAKTVPLDQQPVAIFMGGLPASGKTTAVGKDLQGSDFEKSAVIISNDRVKTMLPGYRGHNAVEYHEESSDIAVELFARTLMQRKNLVYDFTFKDEGTMEARMKALQAAGYRIEVRFTDMDVNDSVGSAMRRMAKEEIQYRTKSGGTGFPGRYSPIEHIRNSLRFSPPPGPPPPRGTRTSVNRQTFERLKKYADAYEIKDNAGFVMGLRTGNFSDPVRLGIKGTLTGGKK
jgi:hypothetical protein